MTDFLPPVVFLECDYGADWPTWVPNDEPPFEGEARTDYFPLDGVGITAELRERLFAWQDRWLSMRSDPDAPGDIDAEVWDRFVSDGRILAGALERELGGAVEVRVRLKPTSEWT